MWETKSKVTDPNTVEFLNAVEIMKMFGWDYYTYISQPSHFMHNLRTYLMSINLYKKENG